MTLGRAAKRHLVLLLGWTFIVLGILGLFLPVLQGILFLLIGLLILSTESDWARRLLHTLQLRFPKTSSHIDAAHRKLHNWKLWFGGQRKDQPRKPRADAPL